MLSRLIKILCPGYSGRTPACTVIAHDVTTMPSNSKTCIDKSSLEHTRLRRRVRTSSVKSIRYHQPDSRQKPPLPFPLASLISIRDGGCKTKAAKRRGLQPGDIVGSRSHFSAALTTATQCKYKILIPKSVPYFTRRNRQSIGILVNPSP